MRLSNHISRRNFRGNNDDGVVITLVAVFILFVVGAMAALSIDVVTLYTARSEAQLAADAAALAAARALANSGATSNSAYMPAAEIMATSIAVQVAQSSLVGGRYLIAANNEVAVNFADSANNACVSAFPLTDPCVTVRVQRTDLPTFFARIWGQTQSTIAATATAEAYNPSGGTGTTATPSLPVAPTCVKPWLLPNLDPTQAATGTTAIFDANGGIINPGLVGQEWPGPPAANTDGIYSLCGGDCSVAGGGITTPAPGAYYPGSAADLYPTAVQGPPGCSGTFNAYQLAVAGCVPQPITCGVNSNVNIDQLTYTANTGTRDSDTAQAAECLVHYNGAALDTDSIDLASPPFEFVGGNGNPVASSVTKDVLVSDSLVTIPVINNPPGTPGYPVQVIGFLQVFLNPQSATMPLAPAGGKSAFEIPATIVNMVGCGANAAGQPILGNGSSPVAVRLISPSTP
jgi:hypothetical protein